MERIDVCATKKSFPNLNSRSERIPNFWKGTKTTNTLCMCHTRKKQTATTRATATATTTTTTTTISPHNQEEICETETAEFDGKTTNR